MLACAGMSWSVPCNLAHKPLCPRESDGQLKEIGRLSLKEGSPDGLTLDSNGNLWIALADQDFVACYAPDTGVRY